MGGGGIIGANLTERGYARRAREKISKPLPFAGIRGYVLDANTRAMSNSCSLTISSRVITPH
jgi:hypothetical protein